ncbi:MAG: DUF559 domain-containing protein [Armatimonadetes bacterium]|nr:DUF559 domain-containing protein [Armatimonadota bacterium]
MVDSEKQPYAPPRHIVRGQKVSEEKVNLARKMRRQMTSAERTLWEHLRANRLDGYHFRRQQVIAGFIVVFYCHRAGLAVEVDGDGHDQSYDADRDVILAQRGVRVVRFSNAEVLSNIYAVVERIRMELA